MRGLTRVRDDYADAWVWFPGLCIFGDRAGRRALRGQQPQRVQG